MHDHVKLSGNDRAILREPTEMGKRKMLYFSQRKGDKLVEEDASLL